MIWRIWGKSRCHTNRCYRLCPARFVDLVDADIPRGNESGGVQFSRLARVASTITI